jgi:chondroitin AC lyase
MNSTDDFGVIKDRVVAELMKAETDDGRVKDIIGRMDKDGKFKDINYDDLSRTAGFPQRRHVSDLVHLARAYQCKSSEFFESSELEDIINVGYKYWVEHDFFGDNWHNNQISTPTSLVELMLLIGDKLPEDLVEKGQPIIGRAHMDASGARPSGDRVVIAGILAKNLLFMGDRAQFCEVIKIIEGEVKFSTGSQGMQHDFSFHHRGDRVNNTTSYGYTKYANVFGAWSSHVAGTEFAFSVEKINHLIDYYLDGIFKQQVYGIYTDVSTQNRSVTHKATFKRYDTLEIERLLQSTDYRKDELEAVIRLRAGEAEPSESFAKFFWQTEHFVFQRPNFYTTVRMFSTRNRNMEVPYNGPGKLTHHRADGTNYLALRGDEYHNIWPVYDWQKISGATILQKPELYSPKEIQKDGLTEFVGAVTDGLYGAVAFDFKSPHDFVEAKKGWFFFDDAYVCLGVDILGRSRLAGGGLGGQAREGGPSVVTTINQALMRGEVTVSRGGTPEILANGSRELDGVEWVHHDGVGYAFPEPATTCLSNQAQEGRWSDITDEKNISDKVVSEDVFTLWLDHGQLPDSASYAYIVVPDVSEKDLAEVSKSGCHVEILANTPEIQAVWHTGLEICQIACYEGGEVEISEETKLRIDSQGMAMVKMKGDRIVELSAADPSRMLTRVSITVSGIYDSKGDDFVAIPNEGAHSTLILVDLPRGVYAGKSVTIKL